jgi:CheY-like chemotaxis protein
MPVMDGWRFTSRLKQTGVPAIPILVMTAAEPHWGYPVPQARVVRKPIRPDALVATLRRLVASSSEEPDQPANATAPSRPGRVG